MRISIEEERTSKRSEENSSDKQFQLKDRSNLTEKDDIFDELGLAKLLVADSRRRDAEISVKSSVGLMTLPRELRLILSYSDLESYHSVRQTNSRLPKIAMYDKLEMAKFIECSKNQAFALFPEDISDKLITEIEDNAIIKYHIIDISVLLRNFFLDCEHIHHFNKYSRYGSKEVLTFNPSFATNYFATIDDACSQGHISSDGTRLIITSKKADPMYEAAIHNLTESIPFLETKKK